MAGAVDDNALARPGESKSLVRFMTCGSVDDGKSTLIGRLLYESDQIYDDELSALAADSRRFGTQRNELDLALLLDGLDAERQQGITIDVAYRYFSSARRKFIVADTPGHEQYTRNMVTGASTADVAVLLIDVRKGLLTQTRRHAHLVSLLGIRKIVIAVNKLDLVDYAKPVFDAIEAQCRAFARTLGVEDVTCIPISALKGDNVTTVSPRTAWYRGPSLLTYLDEVDVKSDLRERPFRMPVQWVNRPSPDFRGYSGRIVSGSLRAGERVRILPTGSESSVSRITTADGDLEQATAGRSVTLTLDDEIDVSRGDMIVAAGSPASIADQFEATLVWMSGEEMLPGRSYLLKAGTRTVAATPASPKYKVNVDTLEQLAARTLLLNDIGVCNLHLDQPIAFDPYPENRETGAFILIDRFTNDTVAAGMLHFALRRARNIHWQAVDVAKHAHARLKGQRACIVWFTGLSGAGKSTIANLVEKKLHALGKHTYLLDGDNVRHGLSKDLGFTQADRVENIRRVAEVSRLMLDAGLIVMVAFISPFRAEREIARRLVDAGEFFEVHVDVPVDVAERRDRKGLYAKARRGELTNFTGIDSPYEIPEHPEVRIDTVQTSPEAAADAIIERLSAAGMFRPA